MLTVSEQTCFDGIQGVYRHHSLVTDCEMTFSVFTPTKAKNHRCPALFYLSGLTCTHENATTKAGFQRIANQLGIFVICPDTSPRGLTLPGEHDSYDFGSGAGFYLNATQAPWNNHYRMYDYVVEELPELVTNHFNLDPDKMGITGHSMGGHGALVIGLRNPERFKTISAFAPIVAPSQCAWGQKAFNNYLGPDTELWRRYDTCQLLADGHSSQHPLLIDQGLKDDFLSSQLFPEKLQRACQESGQQLELRLQADYDHSYYFIASFIEDHLRFHVERLG